MTHGDDHSHQTTSTSGGNRNAVPTRLHPRVECKPRHEQLFDSTGLSRSAVLNFNEIRTLLSSESTLLIDSDVMIVQQIQTPNPAGGTQQGIRIKTHQGKEIVNYPKQHYKNGAAKNKRIGGESKKTLRMLKRARSYLVDQGYISKSQVPSYFFVCLIYNIQKQIYSVQDSGTNDHNRRFINVVNYLNKIDINEFVTQNEIHALSGSDSTQWDRRAADKFMDELARHWKNWYN